MLSKYLIRALEDEKKLKAQQLQKIEQRLAPLEQKRRILCKEIEAINDLLVVGD